MRQLFKIGDPVKKFDDLENEYEIIASKDTKNDVKFPDDCDYLIKRIDTNEYEYVFEEDIYKI